MLHNSVYYILQEDTIETNHVKKMIRLVFKSTRSPKVNSTQKICTR